MQHKATILIVEDDRGIVNLLTAMLTINQYKAIVAMTGHDAIGMVVSHNPDLILLDLGLPDMDGLEVLVSVREWSDIPFIVISARDGEREKVALLDAGANDYVTKPFGNAELLARIRMLLRQHELLKSWQSQRSSSFQTGGLRIDYAARTVTVNGSSIHLTPNEFKIIKLLSKNAGRVLTHEFLIRNVWGPFSSDSQVLRVNMANIRRKIEPNPSEPRYIFTEVGVGYRMLNGD